MSDELDESPLAGRAYESASAGPVNTSERHVGASGHANDDDEDGEDVPNWIAFADFAKSQNKDKNNAPSVLTAASNPVIPKRGEKDFEPASVDRHIDLQQSLLEASRSALFSAISSGVRSHTSKSPNRAIWDPIVERAYMVPVSDPSLPPSASINRELARTDHASAGAVHGVHFLTMGTYVQERKRLELMPEEALYLIERGSIECWTSIHEPTVPMSVQHAWAIMITASSLTPERYQVYAYLRRLGYTVVRSKASASPLNDHTSDNDLKLLEIMESITTTIKTLFKPINSTLQFFKHIIAPYTLTALDRLDSVARGYRSSLVGHERWFTYDQIFTSLQFVKAGRKADIGATKRRTNPYQVFFNVYKPVTKYKKTDPPTPDFRIGAISAQTTGIPDLWDFQNIFAELHEESSAAQTLTQVHSAFSSAVHHLFVYMRSLLSCESETALQSKTGPRNKKRNPVNSLTRPAPYAKLKNGSKSAIIAVVDNGTISFQRFGKSGFEELPWVGKGL